MPFTPWQLAEAISEEGKEAWSTPRCFVTCGVRFPLDQGRWCGCGLWLPGSWFSADTRGAESDSESAVGKVWPGPVCRCEAETVPVP